MSTKVKKITILVLTFLWVVSDLFVFTIKPAEAISSLDTCALNTGAAAFCAQLIDAAATRTAIAGSNAAATATQVMTKVVQRGSGVLLREVPVPNPFNATLGKWAAAAGLGGLLTFMGIPSIDNARQSLIELNAAKNPGTPGKVGQVPGALYGITVTIEQGGLHDVNLADQIGPVSLVSINQAGYPNTSSITIKVANGQNRTIGLPYGGGIVMGVKIWRKDGTSEEEDKNQDPNKSAPPTSWSNATQAQRENIVNTTSDAELTKLYSVAPVAGVPSPSGTEDVYYQPAGTQEWVKLDNPNAQTINIDTNGDGVGDVNIDNNRDGVPDINIDNNGDGVPDLNLKQADGSMLNIDTNGDGVPDLNIKQMDGSILNRDVNGDGVPDVNLKQADGSILNRDTNGDGVADINVKQSDGSITNQDTNGDGLADKNIDANGDGKADSYQPANGVLDDKSFTGTFFVSYAAEKLSQKFPFDIIGAPVTNTMTNECPNYTFFGEIIELCILKDAFIAILIPFKIGLGVIFYQKI